LWVVIFFEDLSFPLSKHNGAVGLNLRKVDGHSPPGTLRSRGDSGSVLEPAATSAARPLVRAAGARDGGRGGVFACQH
jgi:hypothetical protein